MKAGRKISKEFLQKILCGRGEIDSYSTNPGTKEGDNYLSELISIDIEFVSENKIKNYYLLKNFPNDLETQNILKSTNMFWNELNIYKEFLPELENMLLNFDLVNIKLPFPRFFGGEAINFFQKESGKDISDASIMDNYILMEDLRKTSGYIMKSRKLGFDFEHVILVIKELGKLHSLSWIYKQVHHLQSIGSKFSFLEFNQTEEWKTKWQNQLRANIYISAKKIEETFSHLSNSEALVNGSKKLADMVTQIIEIAYVTKSTHTEQELNDLHRIPPKINQHEELWRVVIHGDCWGNNILFQYDKTTQQPTNAILVDLQMMREHCPTLDLVYFIYTNTLEDLRNQHLDNILQIYFEECMNYFHVFQVEPFPGFTLPELQRRFHRSKIYAYFMTAGELDQITNLVQEMYTEGVI